MTVSEKDLEIAENLANDLYLVKNLGEWTRRIAAMRAAARAEARMDALEEAAELLERRDFEPGNGTPDEQEEVQAIFDVVAEAIRALLDRRPA